MSFIKKAGPMAEINAARFGQMEERVTNLAVRQTELERAMNAGFHRLEGMISDLGRVYSQGRATPWQAIGVVATISIAVVTMFFGVVAYTLKSESNTIVARVLTLEKNTVPRIELDQQWQRIFADQNDNKRRIASLQQSKLSKSLWNERGASVNAALAELNNKINKMTERHDVLIDAVSTEMSTIRNLQTRMKLLEEDSDRSP